MIFVSKIVVPKGFTGITLYPFIFLKNSKDKDNSVFITHEKIHLRQQIEMLVFPFYLWYGIEYLVRIIQYKDKRTAYRNISFEREAYQNENDLDYLKSRRFWGVLKYLGSQKLEDRSL